MLESISICLNVIGIGLTIYELFGKKSSNNANQSIQINIIQQINPRYAIEVEYNSNLTSKLSNNEMKNIQLVQ